MILSQQQMNDHARSANDVRCAISTLKRVLREGAQILCLLALAGAGPEPDEGHFRIRAREHFEELRLTPSPATTVYRGFTNTINLNYERPYRYSVGLAGSPLIATLHSNFAPPGFSDTIRVVYFGAEAKVFPTPGWSHLFLRGGCYDTTLSSYGSVARLFGVSELASIGYEFDLGGIGLAPDFGWRWAQLSRKTQLSGSAPSIGLHFYRAL